MLGDKIRELRISKELTQSDLGKMLNKSKNNISQYETGKREPDNETLKKLSEIFNVSLDYLLCKTEIKNYTDNKNITIALHSDTDYDDLPDSAREEINNFIEYVKQKYKKNK